MKRITVLAVFLLGVQLASAQMTQEQKLSDFQQLVGLFSKRYAFTEWKKDAIHFDSLNLVPWINRINASKDDLDFFEICMEYVAANQDGHTTFELPTTFAAALGFTVDLYDGKLLIDNFDRKTLSATDFPVQPGDELVSIDGKPAADILAGYLRFVNDGNSRSAKRTAALLVTFRSQSFIPRAHEIGSTATVVVRRQSGNTETYTLPWHKLGYPYTVVGPAPNPNSAVPARARDGGRRGYPPLLQNLRSFRARHSRFDVIHASGLKPMFSLPDSFTLRLGDGSFDDFYTGTFTANGVTIGYLRYPEFSFFSATALRNEVAFLQTRTDGLIIDMMGNPGGDACTMENFLQYFMPKGFHSIGESLRATWDYVMAYQDFMDFATDDGSFSDEELAQLQAQLEAVRKAYAQNRGFTEPLPLCGFSQEIEPAMDRSGRNVAYTKPITVLTDELSYSAAELFAAIMQDEGRALIYGMRTDGAGGSPNDFAVGVYMEAGASIAQSRAVRKNPIRSPDFPTSAFIENIGVIPDKVNDYMTKDNLLQQGKPFVADFTKAMTDYINAQNKQ